MCLRLPARVLSLCVEQRVDWCVRAQKSQSRQLILGRRTIYGVKSFYKICLSLLFPTNVFNEGIFGHEREGGIERGRGEREREKGLSYARAPFNTQPPSFLAKQVRLLFLSLIYIGEVIWHNRGAKSQTFFPPRIALAVLGDVTYKE